MTLWTGPLLPLAALVWPLLIGALAAIPGLRRHAVALLPLAPLPALWLALAGSTTETGSPGLLLGVTLGLDAAGRLLLGMTAVLWLIAGLAARPMARQAGTARFAGFWCVTLAGNLGVFLARDVMTFYAAFAAVSLASWFLIVHTGKPAAMRAGRVYIQIAITGEVALLLGLLLGAHAAASTAIAEVRAALGAPGIVLLTIGFGIKAGLVPLHVWLPLAHPAAPVPASAVLSGAIVKAGLFGLILFLPDGAAVAGSLRIGPVLMALGLAGGFGAALWGLTQSNPKAVLAYSTISQMGLMILLIGAGGAAREAVPYVALHHGFAKGALFLLVGVMPFARGAGPRLACLALGAAVAASVAGFPLTGGALAKAAAKDGLPELAKTALSLSSVTTALVLAWFLIRLWRMDGSDESGRWGLRLLAPLAAGLLAFGMPWLLWQDWSGKPLAYPVAMPQIVSALWPVALAALPALVLVRRRLPEHPPGDLLLLAGRGRWRWPRIPAMPAPPAGAGDALQALQHLTVRVEDALIRWRRGAMILPLLVLAILALSI